MRKLKSAGLISMLIMVAVFMVSSDLFSKPLTNADNPWHGKARPGFMFGTGEVENDYVIDLLMPVWGNNNALFFFNPHFRYDDNDSNEENLGLGYRRFVMDGKAILGGNLFWDSMRSENDFRYEQIGFGLEALTDSVDLRANYYHPYGTTKERMSTLDKYEFGNTNLLVHKGYEEAMKGADAEIGFLVPIISDTVETRVFGGGYWYDSAMVSDVKGWKVRAEIRPMQILNINIEMKDDDIRSATFIGGYLDLPFSFGDMLAGENPFKGSSKLTDFGTGTRSLKERMTDKVVRDRHIVAIAEPNDTPDMALDENGNPIEIIYVNADNAASGNGTYSNPYQDIADAPGDSRYQDGAWMYVFCDDNEAGCTQTDVNIDLMDDMVLWGQGYQHPLYGLGGGVMPTLDGTSGATVVYLGNNNEVMGLEITGSTSNIGIGADDIESTNIHHNYIHDLDSGIQMYNGFNDTDVDGLHLAYIFDNNTITNMEGNGIWLANYISGDNSVNNSSITTTISNSTIEDNGHTSDNSGIDIYSEIYASDSGGITNATITNRLENSTVSSNGSDGASFESVIYTEYTNSPISYARIDNFIMNNTDTINDNDWNGVWLRSGIWTEDRNSDISNSTITNNLDNNVMSGNGDEGIDIESMISTWYDYSDITDALITATLNNNTVDGNGWDGDSEGVGFDTMIIFADSPDSSITRATIRETLTDNIITNNTMDGVLFDEDSNCGDYCGTRIYTDENRSPVTDALIDINFSGNTISDNGDDGIDFNDVRIYTGYDYTNGGFLTSTENSLINDAVIDIDFTENYIQNNDMSGIDFDEIYIYTSGSSSNMTDTEVHATFTDNVVGNDIDEDANGNDYKGILLDDVDIFTLRYNSDIYTPLMDFTFDNNYVDGNDDENIDLNGLLIYTEGSVSSISDALITTEFIDNTVTDNYDDEGIDTELFIYTTGYSSDITNGDIHNTFTGNTITDNDNEGILLDNQIYTEGSYSYISNSDIVNLFEDNTIGNTFSSNQTDGIDIQTNIIRTSGYMSYISSSTISDTFNDNFIQDNGMYGIYIGSSDDTYIRASGYSSDITDSSYTVRFTGNTITGNGGSGVESYGLYIDTNGTYSDIVNASITTYFEDNDISSNGGYGVMFDANHIETYGSTANISGSTISNTFTDGEGTGGNTIDSNDEDGVYIDNVIATWGDNSTISTSAVTNTLTNNDSTISNNGQESAYGDGVDIASSILTDGSNSDMTTVTITNEFENNVLNENEDQGIELDSSIYTNISSSDITTATINNTLNNNEVNDSWVEGDEDAIYIYSQLNAGGALITSAINDTLTDNVVDGNYGNGITLESSTGSGTDVYGFVVSLLFQGNVVSNNEGNGVNLYYDISDNPNLVNPAYKAWYDARFKFDLGNGLLGSSGNNSFYGNDDWALFHNLTNTLTGNLRAENNYWGSTTPDFPTLIGGTYLNQYTSVNPPLPTDPNPLP